MELLVVVAVIAILSSLLLPALNRSREVAKAIHCVNNLKQIGTALYVYCDSFDNRLPASFSGTYSFGGATYSSPYAWPAALYEADIIKPKKSDKVVAGWTLTQNISNTPANYFDFMCCPAETRPVLTSNIFGAAPATFKDARGCPYGMNAYFGNQYTGDESTGRLYPAPIQRIANPSTTCLVADGYSLEWCLGSIVDNYGPAKVLYNLQFRHNTKLAPVGVNTLLGVGNILYVDGHVSGERINNLNKTTLFGL